MVKQQHEGSSGGASHSSARAVVDTRHRLHLHSVNLHRDSFQCPPPRRSQLIMSASQVCWVLADIGGDVQI
ncbi:hypothetical protein JYU34_014347 [Plutella xylostella]|uniref:Uncharacterized protein n=1 Tax=Plutella xylostella TaxID=51655 RepID=A0ABQ7Q836_PLUXY|nr:hypothetical protein JYU34_014347 [Plutella xylostella]